MSNPTKDDTRRDERSFHFDRHTPQYRDRFEEITS